MRWRTTANLKNLANSCRKWSDWPWRNGGQVISVRLMRNMASRKELRYGDRKPPRDSPNPGANVLKWIALRPDTHTDEKVPRPTRRARPLREEKFKSRPALWLRPVVCRGEELPGC